MKDVCAVIFDRDGTLIEDVPYNGAPEKVQPVAGARDALGRLRSAGLPLAVVSNQSGVARGLITQAHVEAVNRRVDELLGPFDAWLYCPHGPSDGCECRKPKPKLILDAARALGVEAACSVVVGDKSDDEEAARNAGARALRIDAKRTLVQAIEEILAGR